MPKKLKRPIAFIASLAMVCSILLYLPGGVMTDLGFGLAVSAEGEESTAEDTGVCAHSFSEGKCTICDYVCPHGNGFTEDGKCSTCQTQAIAVFMPDSGTATYFTSDYDIYNKFLDRTTAKGEKGTLTFFGDYSNSYPLNLDGDFVLDATGHTISAAVYNFGKLTVKGGTFSTHLISSLETSDLIIEDGLFNGTTDVHSLEISGKAEISGGEFVLPVDIAATTANVTITGGIFHEVPVHNGGSLVISGGTYMKDPSAVLTEDYCAISNSDGTYSVQLHSWGEDGLCTNCDKDRYAVKKAVTTLEDAESALQQAILDRATTIELILSGDATVEITKDNAVDEGDKIYKKALRHTATYLGGSDPQLGDYFAKSNGGYTLTASIASIGEVVTSVTYTYTIDYYTTKEQETAVTNRLNEIYSELGLSNVSSEQEKVYKIYNWIVNNVSYDYAGLEAGTSKTMYTAYGALVDKKAVCQGFAALFYRMCLDNGIDCRIVTGTSKDENHAWNIVKVGDKYYYADPTWDCFVIEDTANSRQAKPGTFFYFLRGTLVNHTESAEENVTNAYTGSMAGTEEYLSAFKADFADGTATALHLDGTALSDAEKTWYDVSAEGTTCPVTITVKGSSGIVSDNGLAGLELLSAVMEHNFGEDGFCTVCDSGYQPATLNNGVYEISNAGQLYWFAKQVNSGNTTINAVLTANITLTPPAEGESNWTAIGNGGNPFTGTFDGANKTISGLFFNKEIENVGLFAIISTGGTVKNVGVVDSYFSGSTGSAACAD